MSPALWSRNLLNMKRHWSRHNIFFSILRGLILVNQIVSLTPIKRSQSCESKKYQPQRWMTIWSLFSWILLALLSPIFVYAQLKIYNFQSNKYDELFLSIALATTITEVLISLLILPTMLLKRLQLSAWLNMTAHILFELRRFDCDLIGWKLLLMLLLKLLYTFYEIMLNLPFMIANVGALEVLHVGGFFGTLYLQTLGYIFAFDLFANFLLLFSCLAKMERCLKRARNFDSINRLLHLEDSIQKLIEISIEIFQFPILLALMGKFVNMLANLYALVNYYASGHNLYFTLVFYCLFIVLDLYSLIVAAQICCVQHDRVKDLLLQRRVEQYTTFADPCWPQDLNFRVLGMFSLNHEFWLFLVSYAASFVVLILQFAWEKANN